MRLLDVYCLHFFVIQGGQYFRLQFAIGFPQRSVRGSVKPLALEHVGSKEPVTFESFEFRIKRWR